MERVTEWRGEHAAIANNRVNYIDLLAAYEDTGLTPEYIRELIADANALYKELQQYKRAEKDGRLVVLPCKAGDTLFDIYEAKENGDGEIRALKVTETHIHLDKRNKAWLIVGGYYFAMADFGKTVFLTREEAERALEGGNERA